MVRIRLDEKMYLEKLDWEWKTFCCDMTNTSRENLFCMAQMITAKKRIYDLLSKVEEFSDEELHSLLSMDHMIDTIYMRLPKKAVGYQVTDIKQAVVTPV